MRRALVWGFLGSQALVGVSLTIALLSGQEDAWEVLAPLLTIAALLLLYAFISGRRAASTDRLGGMVAHDTAQETTKRLNERYDRLHKMRVFGQQFRFSIQLVLTSLFLGLSAWVIYMVLPQ